MPTPDRSAAATVAVWPHPAAQALGRLVTGVIGGEVRTVEPWAAAAALADRTADVALVPSLQVLRQPEAFSLVPGAGLSGVASPSRVLAIGVGLDAVETVAFDPRDGQDALLAQLVLREHFDRRPAFVPVENAGPAAMSEHGAALVPFDAKIPEGAFRLDLGREWADLTTRPMAWGLLASRPGAMPPPIARALYQAAIESGDPTGDGDFQLSLAGLGYAGLESLADHLFYTGTLKAIPELPFVAIEEEEDEGPDALDMLAAGGLPEGE